MNILITGSAGFIGRHLVKYLQQQGGHTLTLIDVKEESEESEKVIRVQASFGDPELLDRILPGQDVVFHLAAVLGVEHALENNDQLRKINLTDTKLLIDKAEEHGIKKIVFSSSSEVYGNSTEIPFQEHGTLSPISEYGKYKIEIEKYLEEKTLTGALQVTVVRFFNIYGSNQRQDFVVNKFIEAVKNNEDLCINWDGNQTRCFTYVEDAIRGLFATMTYSKKKFDIFNIGNPREIPVLTLAKMVLEAHPLSTSNIIILNRNNVKRYDITRRVPSLLRSEQELGYVPIVHLEEGIKKIINND